MESFTPPFYLIYSHSGGLQLEQGAYLLLHASYKNIGILLLLKEPHPSL
jgi:hypothetical protein